MCFHMPNRVGKACKLLVLSADEDLGEAVSYYGQALGFEVDTAQTGTHAARLLRTSDYLALLTDRFIPPWPGLDGIPGLKRRYPRIRIVVLLVDGPVGIASLLRVAGADVVIEPPLRQAALLAALLPGRNTIEKGRSED